MFSIEKQTLVQSSDEHFVLLPGDALEVTYRASENDHDILIARHLVDETTFINRIEIYKIENAFGFKKGYACVMGEK